MKIIENKTFSKQAVGLNVWDEEDVLVRKVIIEDCLVGFDVRRNKKVRFEDCLVKGGLTQERKWEYAWRIGYSNVPSDGNGRIEMVRCKASNIGIPSADYGTFNRDIISCEVGNGPLLGKDCDFSGATDGVIDSKTDFAFVNSKMAMSYRLIRSVKKGYLENCELNNAGNPVPTWAYIWLYNLGSSAAFLNCKFDGENTLPDNRIHGEQISQEQAKSQIQFLTQKEGLLLDPFFSESTGGKYARMIELQEKRVALETDILAAWKEMQ